VIDAPGGDDPAVPVAARRVLLGVPISTVAGRAVDHSRESFEVFYEAT